MSTHVDILAFGPHPEDIEIEVGGSIATNVARSCSVG